MTIILCTCTSLFQTVMITVHVCTGTYIHTRGSDQLGSYISCVDDIVEAYYTTFSFPGETGETISEDLLGFLATSG